MGNRFFKSANLSFVQQIGRMSSIHPQFQLTFVRNLARWTGAMQPSAVSRDYQVKIEYVLGKRPKVWVVQPYLQRLRPDQKIPHTFHDGSICLHLQEDWTPAMFIADTIVPWLALWLYHYEVWHATGKWLGGGHEPRAGK